MSKKIIVAANWKMNKGPEESKLFLSEFLQRAAADSLADFILFAPAIDLTTVQSCLKDTPMGWGAQNIYFEDNGAYTGENSAEILKQINCTHVLVGHSERRAVFAESDEWIAAKVKKAQEHDLIPVICVGESLQQRKAEQTNEVIGGQLKHALKFIDVKKDFIVAYEPVWAIGTGEVATPEQAEKAHEHLKNILKDFKQVPVLYGGSVKPENAEELSRRPHIDGFLVGGASLQVDSFLGIYNSATN